MSEEALLEQMNRRFDAVAELIAQFAQRVDARFEALERVMNTRFEAVERRLDRLETRMSALELQMTGISKCRPN